MADSAASSYANALAEVARSNDTLEQTSADVEKLDKIFAEDQVIGFFTNPTIAVETKREIVDEIARSSSLSPHVANFLNILVDMKRIDVIRDIVKEYEIVYNKLTETELAVVTSVVQLEPQHLSQIAKEVQKLTGAKNVRLKTVIDPSLVAGFTIRYGSSGSKLIDMSVKKQLEEIAAELDLGDIQLAEVDEEEPTRLACWPPQEINEIGMELYPTGSSLPDCSHACGPCTPCRRVMVSFTKCSVESCPVVYRCMCKGRYYHVPSN
ncbi:hypothetical protein DH2020_008385 [Rehmannia glutinosa]|uniref:Uncharacterized protein n=1 Tax=Rehmannia glutinosa TaxID=99300 RepID=A0ABR0U1E0_REHGL